MSACEAMIVAGVASATKAYVSGPGGTMLKKGRVEESLAEHEGVMQALLARDGDAATRRMQEHFRNGLEAAA